MLGNREQLSSLRLGPADVKLGQPLAKAVLIVLDPRRLNRDRQSLQREFEASTTEGSREDARWKRSRGSPGYWAIAGEARLAQPASAWRRGVQRRRSKSPTAVG